MVAGALWRWLLHCGQNIGTIWGNSPNQMNFGQWMAVKIPPEQELHLEARCRQLEQAGEVGTLAARLLRQTTYQRELLQSAVHEIARLELQLMR